MTAIGIDPGVLGAVAVISGHGISIKDTPVAKVKVGHDYLVADMRALLLAAVSDTGPADPVLAVLEQGVAIVRAGGKGGVFPNAKALRGAGIWEGLLAGLGIPYELVQPAKWKAQMGVAKGSPKGEVRVLAQRLFPDAARDLARVKDDGRAEALLLAAYAERRMRGA